MTELMPGFEWKDLGPDGGPFDETSHPKLCLHTTEGSTIEAAEAAFRPYPPHLTIEYARRIRHQHISLDRHSYSLKGSESDDEFIFQVEIVGFAANTHLMSQGEVEWIADSLTPLFVRKNIPLVPAPQGFHGADEGIYPYIASPQSPLRFIDVELRAFSGVMAHQHAPAPDAHWDVGRFKIDLFLARVASNIVPDIPVPIGDTPMQPFLWKRSSPPGTYLSSDNGTVPIEGNDNLAAMQKNLGQDQIGTVNDKIAEKLFSLWPLK